MYFAERVLDQLEASHKLAAQMTSTFVVALAKQLDDEDDDFDAGTALDALREIQPPGADDLIRMLFEQLHALHRLHRETMKETNP